MQPPSADAQSPDNSAALETQQILSVLPDMEKGYELQIELTLDTTTRLT
jgi:hypothetical protein